MHRLKKLINKEIWQYPKQIRWGNALYTIRLMRS